MRELLRLNLIPRTRHSRSGRDRPVGLRTLLPLAVLIAGWLPAADAAGREQAAADPAAAPVRSITAERLIEQLGSASYDRREEAAAQLKQLGAAALPPLRDATTHDDLEVRYRARHLVDVIERAEQQRILSEFRTGGDLELGEFLPGWRRFSEIAGRDASARELFVAMYRDEPEIMRLTDRVGPELRSAVEARVVQFRESKRRSAVSRMSPATVAVLLFVMLEPDLDAGGTARAVITVVIGQRAVKDVLMKPSDSAFRRLMSHWIEKADDVSPAQRIMVAVQYGFDTGVVPSLEIIRSRARGTHLQNAILSVAQLGGPENLEDLEALLDDDSVISERSGSVRVELRSRIREVAENLNEFERSFYRTPEETDDRDGPKVAFRSQVRDVALAAMIHLIGHNPRDYGFTELRPHKGSLFVPNTAGFESDEDRARALRQWRLWTKVQRIQSLEIDEIAVEGAGV